MRLIDADTLIAECELAQKQADRHGREFANAFYSGGGEISTEWWCVEDMIENAPTIEERKTGKWHQRFYPKVEMMVCSECGNEFSHDAETGVRDYNFCPNCGADMRGGQDG